MKWRRKFITAAYQRRQSGGGCGVSSGNSLGRPSKRSKRKNRTAALIGGRRRSELPSPPWDATLRVNFRSDEDVSAAKNPLYFFDSKFSLLGKTVVFILWRNRRKICSWGTIIFGCFREGGWVSCLFACGGRIARVGSATFASLRNPRGPSWPAALRWSGRDFQDRSLERPRPRRPPARTSRTAASGPTPSMPTHKTKLLFQEAKLWKG